MRRTNLFFLFVGSAISVAAQANRYTVVDLGLDRSPIGVNRVGAVVGEYQGRGQIYQNGKWHNLPARSYPFAINRSGDTIGYDKESNTTYWPHNADPITIVMPPNGQYGFVHAMNNSGEVAGNFSVIENGDEDCYTWTQEGGAIDISATQGFEACEADGINNLGQVTGQAYINADDSNAFLWTKGVYEDLGTFFLSSSSEGLAVNDAGVVVGYALVDSGHAELAFVWSHDSGLVKLDPSQKFFSSSATSINASGEIVGWVQEANGENTIAVRFAHSKILKLDSELSGAPGWKLQTATSINDKGVIVGAGELNGYPHGYMLIPVGKD